MKLSWSAVLRQSRQRPKLYIPLAQRRDIVTISARGVEYLFHKFEASVTLRAVLGGVREKTCPPHFEDSFPQRDHHATHKYREARDMPSKNHNQPLRAQGKRE